MKLLAAGQPLAIAALQCGMDQKTARKYRRVRALPSELKQERQAEPSPGSPEKVPRPWRTHPDPLAEVWPVAQEWLKINPGLQAKSLFEELQRRYPGRLAQGQLRTFQRRVKVWRAQQGPPKEVFFPQVHRPGELAASDFCHLSDLNITLGGQPFSHLFYHFVLTYSNWETGSICFAESFESLSAGLQAALRELGGVPQRHRTDSLSAAVHNLREWGACASPASASPASASPASQENKRQEFTRRYQALLEHYGLFGEHIQARQPHQNGDVEQRHYRFKVALDQALLLRGSRDFQSREAYADFVQRLLAQLNAGRQARLREERALLRPLPPHGFDVRQMLRLKVGPSSTIRVQNNVYSVPSRLIGERVEVRLGVEDLELWCGQQLVERMPRLRGQRRHRIHYRHIIAWLVRKPGAFADYRYREDLFPSSHFRMAYDALRAQQRAPVPSSPASRPSTASRFANTTRVADKEYLAILHLAAHQSEQGVEDALRVLLAAGEPICLAAVEALLCSGHKPDPLTNVCIAPVDLQRYDGLLQCAASALPTLPVLSPTELASPTQTVTPAQEVL